MTSTASEIRNLVYQLLRTRDNNDRETCACFGVTPIQGFVLVELDREQPLNMQQLSGRVHLAVSTMSRVVDKLVERKLVSRKIDDEDRRAVLLTLTEAGKDTARELHCCYDDFFERITAALSPRDLDGLVKGLRVIVKQMLPGTETDRCGTESTKC